MSQSAKSNAKLLIIDDDDELREILAMRFRRSGMMVAEASPGRS